MLVPVDFYSESLLVTSWLSPTSLRSLVETPAIELCREPEP